MCAKNENIPSSLAVGRNVGDESTRVQELQGVANADRDLLVHERIAGRGMQDFLELGRFHIGHIRHCIVGRRAFGNNSNPARLPRTYKQVSGTTQPLVLML